MLFIVTRLNLRGNFAKLLLKNHLFHPPEVDQSSATYSTTQDTNGIVDISDSVPIEDSVITSPNPVSQMGASEVGSLEEVLKKMEISEGELYRLGSLIFIPHGKSQSQHIQ